VRDLDLEEEEEEEGIGGSGERSGWDEDDMRRF
jgi:hypothetical protein